VTRAGTWLFTGAVLGLGLRKIYRLLASGELTLDLARGRRLRPLGPLVWSIQAPQEIAFDVIAGPVPHLLETFQLSPTDTGSELRWQGELGTDLWALGQWWGAGSQPPGRMPCTHRCARSALKPNGAYLQAPNAPPGTAHRCATVAALPSS
jgi:hypothetical protein